jgi:hypothetical protein
MEDFIELFKAKPWTCRWSSAKPLILKINYETLNSYVTRKYYVWDIEFAINNLYLGIT